MNTVLFVNATIAFSEKLFLVFIRKTFSVPNFPIVSKFINNDCFFNQKLTGKYLKYFIVQEEYKRWGCFKGKGKGQIKSLKRSAPTKRDTPTKEQREMDGMNKEREVQDSNKGEREMDEFYMEDREAEKSNKEAREMDESNMEDKEMDDSNILHLMADLYQ